HEPELFMIHDDECISDMFTRFTTIINSLKNLGKSYPIHELVRKILRCLPKSWTPMSQKGKTAFNKYPHKEESTKKEELICYKCKKLGHLKNDCTNIKKKEFKKSNEHSKKKKAMIAAWDDSDELSSDEESDGEVANISFMVIEEEEEDEVQFSFDELQNAYDNLFYEYKNVCLKNKSLKK
ncbi:LOW QUALITY PROTEIN: zf-CCHC domain-containing protein/UBN2 domain-containing protein, partial [Cephalotus follicularis]